MSVMCPCGKPGGDGYLCATCTRAFVSMVTRAPEWADQLHLVTIRMTRYTDPAAGRSSAPAPLPYDERAYLPSRELRAALCVAAAACGLKVTPTMRTGYVCAWLARHVNLLRRRPDVAEHRDRIHQAVRRARELCDKPPDTWYAGRCGCGRDLYPRELAEEVKCPLCGKSWNARARREELLAQLSNSLAPGSDIARALTTLGNPVTIDRIKKWRSSGRLTPRTTTGGPGTGKPLTLWFRVGDVRDLVHQDEERARNRRSRA